MNIRETDALFSVMWARIANTMPKNLSYAIKVNDSTLANRDNTEKENNKHDEYMYNTTYSILGQTAQSRKYRWIIVRLG